MKVAFFCEKKTFTVTNRQQSLSLSRNNPYWIWGDSASCSVGTSLLFHGGVVGA